MHSYEGTILFAIHSLRYFARKRIKPYYHMTEQKSHFPYLGDAFSFDGGKNWRAWQDLNPRPSAPKACTTEC